MRCERMHATIPVSTCLARQKKRFGPQMGFEHLECVDCDQGRRAMKGQLNDADAKALISGEAEKQAQGLTKVCKHCHMPRPITDYNGDASRHDGLAMYCRACANQKNREYRARKAKRLAEASAKQRANERREADETGTQQIIGTGIEPVGHLATPVAAVAENTLERGLKAGVFTRSAAAGMSTR